MKLLKSVPVLLILAVIVGGFSAKTALASGGPTYWEINPSDASGVGGGSFNFNNGPIIGSWDDFSNFGSLIFKADFNNSISFDDTASASGNQIQPWGGPPWYPGNPGGFTATYGETFQAPTGATALDDFTFYISDAGDGANFTYQAFLMTWNGPLISTGSGVDESAATILYASNPVSYIGDGSFEAVTATIPGGIAITPGANYEIGFSTLGANVIVPVGPGTGVPDAGSTALMLSLAVSGLAAARRRFAR